MFFFLILTFFLIGVSAFCSLCHIAFFSLPTSQTQLFNHSNRSHERVIFSLLQRPQDLMITLLVCDIAANICVHSATAHLLTNKGGWLLHVAVPFCLTLFFGELIPKNIGYSYNLIVAKKSALPLYWLHNFLLPIRKMFQWSASLFVKRVEQKKDLFEAPSTDETRFLLKAAHQLDLISSDETRIIEGFLNMTETKIKHKMTQRQDIPFYNTEAPISELRDLFLKKGLREVLVCNGDLQNPVGILHISQLAPVLKNKEKLNTLVHPVFFAPLSIDAYSLFKQLKKRSIKTAVLVDEYGLISGTLNKKELYSLWIAQGAGSDKESMPPFIKTPEGSLIANGKLELSTFESLYNTSLPETSKMATLGGWLTLQMGEIPTPGATYQFGKLKFKILRAEPRKIEEIEVSQDI